MQPQIHELNNGQLLVIRETAVEDAGALLDYVESISGESDYLSFGPGEFELSQAEEEDVLRNFRDSDNQLYLVGLVDDVVVGTLTFSAGRRPRVRHSGEFGLSVRKEYWGLGIGSLMLDTLIDWARHAGIVKKINLRVRTDNRRAVRLNESRGFAIEGTIRKEIFLDGKYYHHHWMGLEL